MAEAILGKKTSGGAVVEEVLTTKVEVTRYESVAFLKCVAGPSAGGEWETRG